MKGKTVTISASTFTQAERNALRALRVRYKQDHGLFSESELARLGFLRWLCQTGRLENTSGYGRTMTVVHDMDKE